MARVVAANSNHVAVLCIEGTPPILDMGHNLRASGHTPVA